MTRFRKDHTTDQALCFDYDILRDTYGINLEMVDKEPSDENNDEATDEDSDDDSDSHDETNDADNDETYEGNSISHQVKDTLWS